MEYKFLNATLEDLEDIYKLENEAFKHPYTKDQLIYEIKENPVSKFLLIKNLNNELIGFIDYWITFESSTISQIAINKKYQRLGYGKILLSKCIEDLKLNYVETITLEVRVSNFKAINFYKNFGFIEITTKKNYYSDHEDAIYMMKGLI